MEIISGGPSTISECFIIIQIQREKCSSSLPLTAQSAIPSACLFAVMARSTHRPPPLEVRRGKNEQQFVFNQLCQAGNAGYRKLPLHLLFPLPGHASPHWLNSPFPCMLTQHHASSSSWAEDSGQDQQCRAVAPRCPAPAHLSPALPIAPR